MAIAAILATASSALTADSRRIGAIADNLANLSTEGYRPRDVRTVSQAPVVSSPSAFYGGGVRSVIVEEEGAVDEATQFTRMIQTQSAYSLALQTLRVGEALSGQMLSLSA